MPRFERPREKSIKYGISNLNDEELIALIIGSGYKNKNALDIAHDLLKNNGLYNLLNKSCSELQNFDGIGVATSLRICSCIELVKRYNNKKIDLNPNSITKEDLINKYIPDLIGLTQEKLIVVILSRNKQIIHEENLFTGNESNINVSIRELIRCILLHRGYYFYIIHNHPNDDCLPSDYDIILTENLLRQGHKMKITLLDHLIISNNGYYSFTERRKFDY